MLDLLFEGVIRGLETVSDAIEFGPINAVKINTSFVPQAERDYKRIMRDIDKPGVGKTGTAVDKLVNEPLNMMGIKVSNSEKSSSESDHKSEPVTKPEARLLIPAKKIVDAEIIEEKFKIGDVAKNIGAAIHDFAVEIESDKQTLKCFILAFLQYNEMLEDKDALNLFLTSEEDKQLYIAILHWFRSAKSGDIMNIAEGKIVDKSIIMELKKILEWEMGYVKDEVSKSRAAKIQNGFKEILESLENLKEDAIVNPIVIIPEGETIPKSGYGSDEKKDIEARLNAEFADILADYRIEGLLTYKFNVISDIAELIIMDKEFSGKPRKFRIDPGVVIGNGTNLIYYAQDADGITKDIYINVKKRPEIAKNIITNTVNDTTDEYGYTMTMQEIQQALADTFTNKTIYFYLDMSGFGKYISGMKFTTMKKLEEKLSAVSNILYADNGIPAARLRLETWKGVDEFTLVSDKNCRSPFMMENKSCSEIVPSMKISVIKKDITVEYNDNGENKTVPFTIKN